MLRGLITLWQIYIDLTRDAPSIYEKLYIS